MKNIQMVFERLEQHNLKLKLIKCQFMREEIKYLGLVIGKEGIKPDLDKVEAIWSLTAPTTVREVRSFMGMCSYYCRFIPKFSQIAEPIIALTKKHAPFRKLSSI